MWDPKSFVLLAVLASVAGCGGGGGGASQADPAVEHFKKAQAATVTPHGKIRTATVRKRDGSTLEYATEDGRRFRVSYEKRQDGTYSFGTPEEVK
jgi:hypothetical protein